MPYIDQIRMSINEMSIAIILKEDDGHTIFKWSLEDNIEVMESDVTGPFKVVWDKEGEMYILNNSNVMFLGDSHCQIKGYDYQRLDKLKGSGTGGGLGSERGIRFDSKNHNWIMLEEYLALPFSYMAFVIKNFIETTTTKESREQYVFDIEPYSYLLNRSTCFLDGNFVTMDPA